ncbi:hypothetical protein D6T63_18415 [Arthrobacter cheniae]|uniref:Uncharacterized protein n=1 Tax=Arthrobacter cheniae TaxID=1258888 RepID=A0A3A5M652_9MICC|nr:hypothetical protein D6T63_18415 [Arthrobacter cheniae]
MLTYALAGIPVNALTAPRPAATSEPATAEPDQLPDQKLRENLEALRPLLYAIITGTSQTHHTK